MAIADNSHVRMPVQAALWNGLGRYGSIRVVVAATGRSGYAEIAQLVEHATENRGVASSILALGTTKSCRPGRQSSGSGSAGRASPCQGEGRGFEPRLPLQFLQLPLPRPHA